MKASVEKHGLHDYVFKDSFNHGNYTLVNQTGCNYYNNGTSMNLWKDFEF